MFSVELLLLTCHYCLLCCCDFTILSSIPTPLHNYTLLFCWQYLQKLIFGIFPLVQFFSVLMIHIAISMCRIFSWDVNYPCRMDIEIRVTSQKNMKGVDMSYFVLYKTIVVMWFLFHHNILHTKISVCLRRIERYFARYQLLANT